MKKVEIDQMLLALQNSRNVRFVDALKIAKKAFGEPRRKGSHFVFKMPWAMNPRVNLQDEGGKAKGYQVDQLKLALERLKESLE